MLTISGTDINSLYSEALWTMRVSGEEENSRNGVVKVLPCPLTATHLNPMRRVLLCPQRNANPFFHLMESMWMLAGSNSVEFLALFNSRMNEYSDNGKVLAGAYGHRWRSFFHIDQISCIIHMFKKDPESRRVVLGMWGPYGDLASPSKDVPCNTHCYFRIRNSRLDMMVTARSNDIIWGAYGANSVHFSILQEFVARAVGVGVGRMTQVSFNAHIYERHWPLLQNPPEGADLYLQEKLITIPLLRECEPYTDFLADCEILMFTQEGTFRTAFFRDVIRPMNSAWGWYKYGDFGAAKMQIAKMPGCDWKFAATQWLERRQINGSK